MHWSMCQCSCLKMDQQSLARQDMQTDLLMSVFFFFEKTKILWRHELTNVTVFQVCACLLGTVDTFFCHSLKKSGLLNMGIWFSIVLKRKAMKIIRLPKYSTSIMEAFLLHITRILVSHLNWKQKPFFCTLRFSTSHLQPLF